jgi:transposase
MVWLHGVAADGTAGLRCQLRRSQLLEFFGRLPPCLIGMEACAGAHFWAKGAGSGLLQKAGSALDTTENVTP